MACKEKLMAMIMAKESAAVADHQEVPDEEAAVETVESTEADLGTSNRLSDAETHQNGRPRSRQYEKPPKDTG
jgi:hypothetical protein